MKIVQAGDFHVSGNSVRTSNSQEMSGRGKIAKLWSEFQCSDASSGPTATYGVYSDYESDADGEFTVTVGKKNVAGIGVSNDQYMVFPAKGEMPNAVIDAWKNVWQHFQEAGDYERLYKTDYEAYEPDGEVNIYIGVRPRS